MKRIEKRRKSFRMNNTGAALVTVIVVIAFASIFATVILYMAGLNFHMKSSDMKIKESFYDGEKALEEIRARLMVDASEAFMESYQNTLITYARDAGSQRQTNFNKNFVLWFKDKWEGKSNAEVLEYLKSAASQKYASGYNVIQCGNFTFDETTGTVVLQDVSVEYTRDDYTTKIVTDYEIQAPDIDLRVDKNIMSVPGADDKLTDVKELVDCVYYKNWTKQ
ncbi:MAG: hypothetical protein NC081_10150 [Roseburia sp.]|nr:hypothetical protein [Roseburia sp.]